MTHEEYPGLEKYLAERRPETASFMTHSTTPLSRIVNSHKMCYTRAHRLQTLYVPCPNRQHRQEVNQMTQKNRMIQHTDAEVSRA